MMYTKQQAKLSREFVLPNELFELELTAIEVSIYISECFIVIFANCVGNLQGIKMRINKVVTVHISFLPLQLVI